MFDCVFACQPVTLGGGRLLAPSRFRLLHPNGDFLVLVTAKCQQVPKPHLSSKPAFRKYGRQYVRDHTVYGQQHGFLTLN